MKMQTHSSGSEGSRGLTEIVLAYPIELLLVLHGTIPYLAWMNSRQERDLALAWGAGLSLCIGGERR
jgi:hypothetical protein